MNMMQHDFYPNWSQITVAIFFTSRCNTKSVKINGALSLLPYDLVISSKASTSVNMTLFSIFQIEYIFKNWQVTCLYILYGGATVHLSHLAVVLLSANTAYNWERTIQSSWGLRAISQTVSSIITEWLANTGSSSSRESFKWRVRLQILLGCCLATWPVLFAWPLGDEAANVEVDLLVTWME